MLDSIWAQQPGQEVVYEWVQWLQSSTLSHLGFDDGIVIRQPDDRMVGPVDIRVVGEILSVEDVVQRLISYNEEHCHESFLRGLHACMICFSEYTGNSNALVDTHPSWSSSLAQRSALDYTFFQDLPFTISQLYVGSQIGAP
jgi:hypothetical protein